MSAACSWREVGPSVGRAPRLSARANPLPAPRVPLPPPREARGAASLSRGTPPPPPCERAHRASRAPTRRYELYSFGIRIILRELKLRKVTDKAEKSAARQEIARDLREGLLELGPTFIKLGQLLSTRIDILTKVPPPSY